ncbi:hypothetical protein E2C01_060142 [Portunus trituberculatus]|uniref:Uncharacterized protein n=1 Tax=Portunus trituberculatus TaxID=210409 RepID=A0A5B7H825_PORTR|nr:hypothetical protein [Portunus trituberculatus]
MGTLGVRQMKRDSFVSVSGGGESTKLVTRTHVATSIDPVILPAGQPDEHLTWF